uniref:Uncharacterized protein n=1 Tax=Siphoviridae sp. ctt8434 TaxID=2825703 RepID=A0A8S5U1H2_9CAUD|nr:MAG TPA: hypothetical protein [Siphoviridae sp. ctt8434]
MTNIKISELSELQYPYMNDFLPIVDTRKMETKKIKYKNLVSIETDPVFTSSAASGITENDITNWNNKSDFSSDYNDLSNKPSIPTIPTNISAFENDVGYLTEHQDISSKEDKANKVTSLDGNSTNAQYPSAKVVYDELNKRLKYKGHVNSKEDLPTAGQVNGALINPSNSIRTEFANNIISNDITRKEKIENARTVSYNYYLGMWFDKVNYAFMLETNYPEIIDAIYFAPTNDYSACVTMYVHINASTSKPCKVSNINIINYEDGTSTSSNAIMNKPGWVYKDTGWNDLFKALSMFSNIGHSLKFKKNPNVTSYQYNTLELNGFFYNESYKMLDFDENGNTSFVTTTPSDINENDVYTVGANYDLVRGNAVEQKWEPLAPKSDLYKTYTGYDETKTQVLKNINGTLTWVEETQN